jgi:hypothetical protein
MGLMAGISSLVGETASCVGVQFPIFINTLLLLIVGLGEFQLHPRAEWLWCAFGSEPCAGFIETVKCEVTVTPDSTCGVFRRSGLVARPTVSWKGTRTSLCRIVIERARTNGRHGIARLPKHFHNAVYTIENGRGLIDF